jgi:transcriptional regulator with XRE-family HTH domain
MSGSASELRRFLINARGRLSPRSVGLPSTGQRRVPGLRRGEVADLIGVSEDWYTQFERGRARISTTALARLGDALLLSSGERAQLIRLARAELSSMIAGNAPEVAPRFVLPAYASKEIRALGAFFTEAPSASSTWELTALALRAICSGVDNVAFASRLAKTPGTQWCHRSEDRQDFAEHINGCTYLDDDAIRTARLRAYHHCDAIGTADKRAKGNLYSSFVGKQTPLRSGFRVRIPLSDSYIGLCRAVVGFPQESEMLFVNAVASIIRLTVGANPYVAD